jgi:hypothetical protein
MFRAIHKESGTCQRRIHLQISFLHLNAASCEKTRTVAPIANYAFARQASVNVGQVGVISHSLNSEITKFERKIEAAAA